MRPIPSHDSHSSEVRSWRLRRLTATAGEVAGVVWVWLRRWWADAVLVVGFLAVALMTAYLVLLGR